MGVSGSLGGAERGGNRKRGQGVCLVMFICLVFKSTMLSFEKEA